MSTNDSYWTLLDRVHTLQREAGEQVGLPATMLAQLEHNVATPAEPVAYVVVCAYLRSCGRHFLPGAVLDRLVQLRSSPQVSSDPVLQVWLDCVLDKYDGCHRYDSYLCADLLRLDEASGTDQLSQQWASGVVGLLLDVAQFEHDSRSGHAEMAVERPDEGLVVKRLHLIERLVGQDCFRRATGIGAQEIRGAERPLTLVDGLPSGLDGRQLLLSMAPVYLIHDEYLFIRVLQCFELTFQRMAREVETAARVAAGGDHAGAAAHVDKAHDALAATLLLFSLLATMRPQSFATFRQYTEGASAIQSANYKRFEIGCRRPTEARLSGAAFEGVPQIRWRAVEPCRLTVYDALGNADAHRGSETLRRSTDALERIHQKWKQTHVSLARRMIGDSPGTGYTAGIPYLRGVLANRLFAR